MLSQWRVLQVKADKLREVKNGHDGTWVAHPALVTLALEIFNEHMPQPNQIDKKREDVHVTQANLLEVLPTPLTQCQMRCSGLISQQAIRSHMSLSLSLSTCEPSPVCFGPA